MGTFRQSTLTVQGRGEVLIRTGTPDDAEPLLACVREMLHEGQGFITSLEEFTVSVEDERKWIAEHVDNPYGLLLVALAGGRIVGNINFRQHARSRQRHAGVFGIGVLPAWQGCGIGEALVRSLLQWARENPRIECVQLVVLADNPRAIRLYYKCGFAVDGVKPRAVKYADGHYTDEVSMHVFV